MDLNLIVIDDWLPDPDKIRSFALKQNFTTTGTFPGVRSRWINTSYKEFIDTELTSIFGKKPIHKKASTQFQLVTGMEGPTSNWIHHDLNTWAGVLYLSPDAPLEYGTSLFRHKETKIMYGRDTTTEDHLNPDEWEETSKIGNIYNRLILYNGEIYHRSTTTGYGDKLENSRLTQVFFFDLEEDDENSGNWT